MKWYQYLLPRPEPFHFEHPAFDCPENIGVDEYMKLMGWPLIQFGHQEEDGRALLEMGEDLDDYDLDEISLADPKWDKGYYTVARWLDEDGETWYLATKGKNRFQAFILHAGRFYLWAIRMPPIWWKPYREEEKRRNLMRDDPEAWMALMRERQARGRGEIV